MAGFCDFGCTTGMLVVDGVDMACAAWDIPDLTPLWYAHTARGQNLLLPSAPGQRAYPRRLDAGEYQLTLFVTGSADMFGTAFPDPWHGLRNNLDVLWTQVFSPVSTGDGTRPCVLEVPGGSDREADVQFDPLESVGDIDDPTLVAFTMTLTIPAGRFV
jgi:hypothetical protein